MRAMGGGAETVNHRGVRKEAAWALVVQERSWTWWSSIPAVGRFAMSHLHPWLEDRDASVAARNERLQSEICPRLSTVSLLAVARG